MTPTHIMTYSAIAGVFSVICLIINFFRLLSVENFGVKMATHVFFGILAWLSGFTFCVGLVMFLINYAKHA